MDLAEDFLRDFDEGDKEHLADSVDDDEYIEESGVERTHDLAECVEDSLLVDTATVRVNLLKDHTFLKAIAALELSNNEKDDKTQRDLTHLQSVNIQLQRVDTEILTLFQATKDIYGKRFPELETLIPVPLDYLLVVKRLGNNLNSVNDVTLSDQLSNTTILAVSVAASVSVGHPLKDDELAAVLEYARDVDDLVEMRTKLLEYIESCMTWSAPNLTAVIGASLAARLVMHAGGLVPLATMPSQNLMLLGGSAYARRTAAVIAAGSAGNAGLPAAARSAGKGYGVLFESDLVQNTVPAYRGKALKLVSGKTALAVRKDVYNNDGTKVVGIQLRQAINESLKKAQAPPPARLKKPLPVPEEQFRAKRGGRRKRRWKEKYGMTEARKRANRIQVTIDKGQEDDVDDEDDNEDDF